MFRTASSVSRSVCTLILTVLALAVTGCRHASTERAGKDKSNMLRHAERLKMWEEGETVFAEVYGASDSVKPIGLYIFPSGENKDVYARDYPDAVVIPEGTGNLMLFTSVHSSALEELGAGKRIGSVADALYFGSSLVREGLAKGTITDMGTPQQLSKEKLIAQRPSLALVSVYDGMDDSMLRQLGIPIVYMADNLEASPLGRAEWIRFIGLLAGEREMADSIFNAVEKNYTSMKSAVSGVKEKPRVMVENMYQGIWYVPAGDSYAARMLEDAGGDYLWKDSDGIGSLSLSFEQVLQRGADADIWLLKLFGEELTAGSLEGKDERNMLFGPVRKKGVWYSNTAESKLFDEFPYHPDLLLKDYIHIFHPEVFPGYMPRYFKPMRY